MNRFRAAFNKLLAGDTEPETLQLAVEVTLRRKPDGVILGFGEQVIDFAYEPDDPPLTEYVSMKVVNLGGLTIRSTPEYFADYRNKVGSLNYGDVVEVEKDTLIQADGYTWRRLRDGNYCAEKHSSGKVYLRVVEEQTEPVIGFVSGQYMGHDFQQMPDIPFHQQMGVNFALMCSGMFRPSSTDPRAKVTNWEEQLKLSAGGLVDGFRNPLVRAIVSSERSRAERRADLIAALELLKVEKQYPMNGGQWFIDKPRQYMVACGMACARIQSGQQQMALAGDLEWMTAPGDLLHWSWFTTHQYRKDFLPWLEEVADIMNAYGGMIELANEPQANLFDEAMANGFEEAFMEFCQEGVETIRRVNKTIPIGIGWVNPGHVAPPEVQNSYEALLEWSVLFHKQLPDVVVTLHDYSLEDETDPHGLWKQERHQMGPGTPVVNRTMATVMTARILNVPLCLTEIGTARNLVLDRPASTSYFLKRVSEVYPWSFALHWGVTWLTEGQDDGNRGFYGLDPRHPDPERFDEQSPSWEGMTRLCSEINRGVKVFMPSGSD